MKTADLYIRVSTDEQADKGYSQRSQEELLRRYCQINDIHIRKVIFEDHSAKTFNRPEWKKYLLDLRKRKHQADLVLFIKWDRFARNAGDAYQMINLLRKLGVEPQAIEQPLDLGIPENKIMLAFYLAAPEVENDRRALNVIHGMRRAQKEGRFMGIAPFGYVNKTDESGKKYIAISEAEARIMRWSFEQISKGLLNTEQIYKQARSKGFPNTKSVFWDAIRNPVYCGKIAIKKYKDEEASVVPGNHEPLIPEHVFYKVQDVLDGRKRGAYRLKIASDSSLPLRGFLICPMCARLLTGSSSKGRSKYYVYYHCTDGCLCRFPADQVNRAFTVELSKYTARPDMIDIYKAFILESWNEQNGTLKNENSHLKKKIKETEEKLAYVRELLATKQLEPVDFKEMKARYNVELDRLESQLHSASREVPRIEDLLDRGIGNLLKLSYVYEQGDSEQKRLVIGSMFPKNSLLTDNGVRTARVNEATQYIYLPNQ